jgi:hypothetical protein
MQRFVFAMPVLRVAWSLSALCRAMKNSHQQGSPAYGSDPPFLHHLP